MEHRGVAREARFNCERVLTAKQTILQTPQAKKQAAHLPDSEPDPSGSLITSASDIGRGYFTMTSL